ncbi:MAG TPA: hypothetical protein VK195_21150 [Burkholderiaceae bacterium]|nr:hypothetical protein [Burkholderiaceae bacterium]
MGTISRALFLESRIGELVELPRCGSALELPWVYDRVAEDICAMEKSGQVEVIARQVRQVQGETLITHLAFRRLL